MHPSVASCLAVGLGLGLAGCAGAPPLPLPGTDQPIVVVGADAAVPAAVAAWLVAGACVGALPSSMSLPLRHGAPVRQLADGYAVELQQNGCGRWFAAADGWLRPAPDGQPSAPLAVAFAPAAAAPPRGEDGQLQVQVRIVAAGGGCRVDGELRLLGGPMLARDIEVLLQLAAAERRGAQLLQLGRFAEVIANAEQVAGTSPVGCSAPAPLLARCRLQQAAAYQQRGELRLCYRALCSARLADPGQTGCALWTAQLAERLGLDDEAAASYRLAALTAADAAVRASANAGLQRLQQRRQQPGRELAAAAAGELRAGWLGCASALLNRARARAPDPQRDLRLLRDLQLARGDQRAALATALLLREYAPSSPAERLLGDDLQALGSTTLAARSRQRLLAAPLAQPPR